MGPGSTSRAQGPGPRGLLSPPHPLPRQPGARMVHGPDRGHTPRGQRTGPRALGLQGPRVPRARGPQDPGAPGPPEPEAPRARGPQGPGAPRARSPQGPGPPGPPEPEVPGDPRPGARGGGGGGGGGGGQGAGAQGPGGFAKTALKRGDILFDILRTKIFQN